MLLTGMDFGPLVATVAFSQTMFYTEHLVAELATHAQVLYVGFAFRVREVASFLICLQLLQVSKLIDLPYNLLLLLLLLRLGLGLGRSLGLGSCGRFQLRPNDFKFPLFLVVLSGQTQLLSQLTQLLASLGLEALEVEVV